MVFQRVLSIYKEFLFQFQGFLFPIPGIISLQHTILGKAIVGTKPSGGIRDQITDGKDGLIVDATIDGLTKGILKLINDKALRHSFEQKIQQKDFSGSGEIHKFLSYLSE